MLVISLVPLLLLSYSLNVGGTIRMPDYNWREQAEWDAVYADLALAIPSLVTPAATLGVTLEGRPIHAVCLGVSCSAAAGSAAPALLLTSLIHSREPLGALVNLQFAASLVARASESGDVGAAALLSTRRLIIVPNVNPDGYSFNIDATNQQRKLDMQRKNRRDTCPRGSYLDTGVDLNRNFNFKWDFDDGGSSPNACAEDYRGPAPLSEPESSALAGWLAAGASAAPSSPFAASLPPPAPPPAAATPPVPPLPPATAAHAAGIAIALNWHSYGRFINVPWAVKDIPRPPADTYAALLGVARRVAAAGGEANGGVFGYGHPYDGGLYTCNGEASDWMLSSAGILAFSPELGPEFEREPFEEGMWPKALERPALVAEGLRMAETALWAAGPLPAITLVSIVRPTTAPTATTSCGAASGEHCAFLRIQITVANDGARPHRGDVVVGVFPVPEAATTTLPIDPLPSHACWPSAASADIDVCYASWAVAATAAPAVCLVPVIDTGAPTWGAAAAAGRRVSHRALSDQALSAAAAAAEGKVKGGASDLGLGSHGARGRVDLATDEAFLAAAALVVAEVGVPRILVDGAPLPDAAMAGAAAVRLDGSTLPPFHSLSGVVLGTFLREADVEAARGEKSCPRPRGLDGSLLRLVVSDADLCSIYSVRCGGELLLLHRGLAGCMPCAAYRVVAAFSGNQSAPVVVVASPTAAPKASYTDIDTSSLQIPSAPTPQTQTYTSTLALMSTVLGTFLLFGVALRFVVLRLRARGWMRVPTDGEGVEGGRRVDRIGIGMFAVDPTLHSSHPSATASTASNASESDAENNSDDESEIEKSSSLPNRRGFKGEVV